MMKNHFTVCQSADGSWEVLRNNRVHLDGFRSLEQATNYAERCLESGAFSRAMLTVDTRSYFNRTQFGSTN